jgi:hypothetical protein
VPTTEQCSSSRITLLKGRRRCSIHGCRNDEGAARAGRGGNKASRVLLRAKASRGRTWGGAKLTLPVPPCRKEERT